MKTKHLHFSFAHFIASQALACSLALVCALLPSAAHAQNCQLYGFNTSISGFDCSSDQGEICFVTNTDLAFPIFDCIDYVVELIYPSGAFIYTDLGDFYLHSLDPMGETVLRHEPELIFDLLRLEGCLKGILQQPGTVFTLRVVNPDPPQDEVSSQTFTLDNVPVVGSPGGSVLLSSQILPNGPLLPPAQAVSTGQRVALEGRLIVDIDYTFGATFGEGFLNGLNMGADAALEVQGGKRLRLFDAAVRPCDGAWDRMLVRSGGELEVFRSRIEGADVAIEMEDNSSATFFAVQLSGNGTGVGVYGSSPKAIDLNFWASPFFFNTISEGESGLDLEHVEMFALDGGVGFSDLEEGIRLDATDINISNISFSNCGISLNAATYTDLLRAMSITSWNGRFGIASQAGIGLLELEESFMFGQSMNVAKWGSQANDRVRVRHNRMLQSDNNIVAFTSSGRSEIEFNERLSAERANIVLFGNQMGNKWVIQQNDRIDAYGPYGRNVFLGSMSEARVFRNAAMEASLENVWTANSEGAVAGYNTLTSSGGASTPNVRWIGSPGAQIYCNLVTAGGVGLQFEGNSAGTDVRGNDLAASSGFNLSYGSSGSAFGATGPQYFKGNRFAPSSPAGPSAINYSPENIAQQSQYLVGDPNQGSALYPYFISAYADWFESSLEGVDATCPPGLQSPPTEDKIARLKEGAFAGAGLLSAGISQAYGLEVTSDTELKLFRQLYQLDQMGELPTELQAHYGQYAPGAIGKLVSFGALLETAASYTQQEEDIVEGHLAGLRALLDSMGSVQRYEMDGKYSPVALPSGQAVYDEMLAEANQLLDSIAVVKAARQSILEGELPALSALNSSVPASGPAPLQNLKTANALLLERLSTAFEGFSGAEVAALETLAVQCAAIGGEGVHLARALLAEHRQEAEWAYPDDCLPAAPGIGLRQPVPNGGQASAEPFVWPNPASGRALLELPEGHAWAWAAVFNAQGQELRRTALSPGQRQAELSTEGWAPGLYFLRLGPGGSGPVLKLAVAGR